MSPFREEGSSLTSVAFIPIKETSLCNRLEYGKKNLELINTESYGTQSQWLYLKNIPSHSGNSAEREKKRFLEPEVQVICCEILVLVTSEAISMRSH